MKKNTNYSNIYHTFIPHTQIQLAMIKAITIDDEESGRKIICQYVEKYCDGIEIVGQADSVKSGIDEIEKKKPDLVFLDIQMQDGTGFNLLEQIQNRNFKVIFVTSYDQFALKAFKYSATDYLLKPVDPDAFAEAVSKIQIDIEKADKADKTKNNTIDELLSNVNSFEKIGLPTSDGIRFVKVDDIVRCESDSSYTIFFMNSKEKIVVSKNLKNYEDLLSDRKFLRIHKSHLINTRYVEQYINGDGGQVVMSDGSTVEVSRRKKEELIRLMTS